MHISVLLEEVIEAFKELELKFFLDGTLGAGGHAKALLTEHPEIKYYLGFDRDTIAQKIAQENLSPFTDQVLFFREQFSNFEKSLKKEKIPSLCGVLLDLGISSMQLDSEERGFSFRFDGELDMRMDNTKGKSAADILNTYSEEELVRVFKDYGEIPKPQHFVDQVLEQRVKKPFQKVKDLLDLKAPYMGRTKRKHHPFTLVFQALRIEVNEELSLLEGALKDLFKALRPGGRLAVITFHSLEDRVVKHLFRELSSRSSTMNGRGEVTRIEPKAHLITRKGIAPREEEIRANPRSRSAKLRVIEKV